jgi:hypothetical protein
MLRGDICHKHTQKVLVMDILPRNQASPESPDRETTMTDTAKPKGKTSTRTSKKHIHHIGFF